MVDLVKIRKKARKAAGGEPEAAADVRPPSVAHADATTPLAEPVPIHVPVHTDSHPPPPTPDSQSPSKLDQFKHDAGRKREGFIHEVQEASSGDQLELLTFALAGEQYAVAIDHIVEIVTPRTATRVPNADETIVGIISLRGTIVTVIDVRRKLRHGQADRGADPRIVVVENGGETLGFEVDRVLRVVKVDAGEVEPHPVVHTSEQSEAIRGVFRQANALTILLDLDKLLA